MGLQDFLRDAKNILLGNSGEITTEDFKREIEIAVKSGIITKAEAAELIQSRKSLKTEASEIEKNQIESIVLDDGTVVSVEEAKKKKEEKERKKKEKENQLRNSNIQVNEIMESKKETQIKKPQTQNGRLTIDRNKLQKQIEKEELEERTINNKGRDEKN